MISLDVCDDAEDSREKDLEMVSLTLIF